MKPKFVAWIRSSRLIEAAMNGLGMSVLIMSLSAAIGNASTVAFCQDTLLAATIITPERLTQAEVYMGRALTGLSVWEGADWEQLFAGKVDEVTEPYSLALSYYIRGLDMLAGESVARLARVIKSHTRLKVDPAILRNEIAGIALRPEIERVVAAAPPLLAGRPDVAQQFSELNGVYPDALFSGPQQLEMVRIINQYARLTYDDKMLTLGVGMPAVLTTLRAYGSLAQLIGIDTCASPSPQATEFLASRSIEVVGQRIGDHSLDILSQVGPFQIIGALDLLASDPQFRKLFSLSSFDLVRALRRMLAPGGLLIILNDFGSEPTFTRAEAERAGLTIVRWNLDRTLAPEISALVPYQPDAQRAGEMKAFVLRRGPERRAPKPKFTSHEVEM